MTRRPRRRSHGVPRRRFALLCLALLVPVVAACANIPQESQPKVMGIVSAPERPPAIAQPRKNINPEDLVRGFIEVSSDEQAAETYLTDEAKTNWHPSVPTIIADDFNTLPETPDKEAANHNEVVVQLSGKYIGRLGTDSAFEPNIGPFTQAIKVQRQPDGQWRISEAPNGLVLTESEFTTAYRQVRLRFLDPDQRMLVPDPRYVRAESDDSSASEAIDLLLGGPSEALTGAVTSAIGPEVSLATNVVEAQDGALEVNLTNLGNPTAETRKLIAAQIVMSLQDVTASRVRLLVDGLPLIASQRELRQSDIDSFDLSPPSNPQLEGLVLADDRIRSLGTGDPVPGPAGSPEVQIDSAAQSLDGRRLAVVERTSGGMRLRIGEDNGPLRAVDLTATTLTRPTWRPPTDSGSNEVWTVADGNVVRLVHTSTGEWVSNAVNASAVQQYGVITELRLSRDGVRVAAIAGGHLVVGSVVRTDSDSVAIQDAQPLQQTELTNVVGVDWLAQDTLVVATSLASRPVINIEVDGLRSDSYSLSNLTPPITAIAAMPSRQVVVTDGSGMWTTSVIGQVWQRHAHNQGPGAVPFYPG